eukprot:s458_g6.t2
MHRQPSFTERTVVKAIRHVYNKLALDAWSHAGACLGTCSCSTATPLRHQATESEHHMVSLEAHLSAHFPGHRGLPLQQIAKDSRVSPFRASAAPASVDRFLHRGRDGRILDVDEFEVAKALLAGETELLSQEVDGRHLFDWCCCCGHQSTTAAMISYRVPECVFKGCSWGISDEEEGFWMQNWDASLQDAKSAAERAAAMPLVRALLEALRSQLAFDGIATEEATAYLLDVAILVGDAELAKCCAKHCTRFPLRRWRGHELVEIIIDGPCLRAEIPEKDVLLAALAAGLKLEQRTDPDWDEFGSLAEAIVLSADAELWQRVQGLQLQLGPWPTYEVDFNMARFLFHRSGDDLG